MWAAILLVACQADIDEHVKKGFELLKVDDSRAALVEFNAALEKNPKNTKALLGRGFSYLRQFRYAEAENELNRAVEFGGRDPQIWYGRGLCREKRRDYPGARQDLETALRGGLRNAHLLATKARCECHLLDFRGCAATATEALDLNPRFASALESRIQAWYGLHAWDNLLRDIPDLKKLNPRLPATYDLLAWAARSRRGDTPEEPAPPDAKDGTTSFILGTRHLINDRYEAALEAFTSAAKSATPGGPLHTLARAEIRAIGLSLRRKVLDRLEARFAATPRFEAVYRVENGRKNERGLIVTGFRLYFDRYGFEAVLVLEAKNDDGPVDPTVLHATARQVQSWGPLVPEPSTTDVSAVMSTMTEYPAVILRELNAIAPPPPGFTPPAPAGAMLGLDFEPRRSADQKNTFSFSLGRSSRAASWFMTLAEAGDVSLLEEEDALWFDLPAKNLRIALDPETGMLKGYEGREYDGRVVKVSLVSLAREMTFPELTPPGGMKRTVMGPEIFLREISQDAAMLPRILDQAFERWDAIRESKREPRVANLLGTLSAAILDRYYAYALDGFARGYVSSVPDPTVEGFTKVFRENRGRFTAHLRRIHADLLRKTRESVIGGGLDTRLHPALDALLKRGMDFDAVEKIRIKSFGDRLAEALARANASAGRK